MLLWQTCRPLFSLQTPQFRPWTLIHPSSLPVATITNNLVCTNWISCQQHQMCIILLTILNDTNLWPLLLKERTFPLPWVWEKNHMMFDCHFYKGPPQTYTCNDAFWEEVYNWAKYKICLKEYHTNFGYQSVTPTVKNDLFSVCEWQAIFSDGVANNFPTIISIDNSLHRRL